MIGGRELADYSLAATSAGTGVKQTNVLDPMDLSRCRELQVELIVTSAASTASDILQLELQDSSDGNLTWNTRARAQVLGNQSASATAPYVYRMVLTADIPLQSPEKAYIETGSAGGTDINVGTVINGPFPPPWRKNVTTGNALSSWRFVWTQTDASGSAQFVAEVRLHGHAWTF